MASAQILEQGIFSDCENCKKKVYETHVSCNACGFPQYGSKDQKVNFYYKKPRLNQAKNQMYWATSILGFLSVFCLVLCLINIFNYENYETGILNAVLTLLYGGMAIGSIYRPLPTILARLFLYLVVNGINAYFIPGSLTQGIFIKTLIIAAFIRAIMAVYVYRTLRKSICYL